ncbi:O-antigen ligase family protein [Croceitalea rosinachiae]|uniref:O-antigen ligase family protein n=1 Tax=Croceitalea rosinachiae TaxID=3075596 RepID=A0ABU3ADG2_9FLAO|nr:O-antigen ligase family protein [Croceitalea sp. F388]MDT0607835.1 O-antigen ligase family protein [Croceitalea sp. F388]
MKLKFIFIAILLAIDQIFIRFKIGFISFDRLLEFIFFFILFKDFVFELKVNSFFRKWCRIIVCLAAIQLLFKLYLSIIGELEFQFVYTPLIKSFSFIVFSFLFLILAKEGVKYLNIIVLIHLFILVFAFLQHPLSPIADQMLEIKKLLYVSAESERIAQDLKREGTYITGGYGDRFRLAGPFANTINFSYFAFSSFALNLFLFIKYKRKQYLFLLIVLFIASILSQTRSLLLAESFLIFGYLFFAPFKKHFFYKIAIVLGALILSLSIYTAGDVLFKGGSSRITSISANGHSDSRPLLWITAFYAVASNPFGLTQANYQIAREEMFRIFGNPDILYLWPHNGAINIGFHYTFFGYIIFVFLVSLLLKNINNIENKKLVIFFKIALIGYVIHTSFHNNFILESDYTFLMILMLIPFSLNNEKSARDNVLKWKYLRSSSTTHLTTKES